ncbi:hypothetical protein HAHI6034_09445 [Hathewaya histolytica]|uniref:DUF4872 domain-containing protein n=1 Tax=Hathewaya histolytica TaxID=1498 RepID=A0A4V6KE77_HATHI|nr:hypothetical protein [Hathewaya histolytica]VTQ93707.1 Uncharacterised protein [Hathewaya histolytica]
MLSCDIATVTSILKNVKYEEAILVGGLGNILYRTSYNKHNMYMANGRGVMLVDELLDKLQVAYKELTMDELYKLNKNDYKNVLIITPIQLVDHIEKINKKASQFLNTYSTFRLVDIEKDTIILELASDVEEVYKRINKEQLEIIESLKVMPLDINIKYIYIENDYEFRQDKINLQINKSVARFLNSEQVNEEEYGWWKGDVFYEKLFHSIKEWESHQIKVIKFILYQSLLSGSSFFYRKEFSEALDLLELQDTSPISQLEEAAKNWRNLGRHLKNHLAEQKDIDFDYVEQLIKNIKYNELSSFKNLQKQLVYITK